MSDQQTQDGFALPDRADISTAPKDGTIIEALNTNRYDPIPRIKWRSIYFSQRYNYWVMATKEWQKVPLWVPCNLEPTHWRPKFK